MSAKTNEKEVREFIESYGCKMLSEYRSANALLQISCKCGNIRNTSYTNFRYAKHKLCSDCAHKQGGLKTKFTYEYVKNFIEQQGCKLLTSEYKDANTPMTLQCKCGEIWNVDFHVFARSKHKACKICSSTLGGLKLLGKNNPQFGKKGKLNPLFNNEQRKALAKKFRSPEYIAMRETILNRDKNTCAKCKFTAKFKKDKKKLNIHHLFNKTEWPKWFYRLSNLITLCSNCHKNFHKTFGYRNNKPNQMKIYLNR